MASKGTVVILPGIGGSQLSYKGGSGGKTALWWNPVALLANTPLAMGLNTDGKSPWPLVGKTLFPDGPVAFGIYEPLITAIANAGYTPVFWAYDWRLKQTDLATAFVAFLQGQSLSNPFYVVCHSMGGIVAQLAYPTWKALGSVPTWATTIYLGTPHGGSYWSGACLSGLWTTGNELYSLGFLLDWTTQSPGVIDIAKKAALAIAGQLVGSWPSVYGLLPSSAGQWAALDALAVNVLQLSYYATTPGGQQNQWLQFAQTLMTTLVNNYTQPRPAELSIYGLDQQTPNALNALSHPELLASYKTASDGDGTVIEQRAVLPVGSQRGFKRTAHNSLPNTLGPINLLLAALSAVPTGDEVLLNLPGVVNTPPQPIPLETLPNIPAPFVNLHGDP